MLLSSFHLNGHTSRMHPRAVSRIQATLYRLLFKAPRESFASRLTLCVICASILATEPRFWDRREEWSEEKYFFALFFSPARKSRLRRQDTPVNNTKWSCSQATCSVGSVCVGSWRVSSLVSKVGPHCREMSVWVLQSLNLQGKSKMVRVIKGKIVKKMARRKKIIHFELSGGSSYRESNVFISLLVKAVFPTLTVVFVIVTDKHVRHWFEWWNTFYLC